MARAADDFKVDSSRDEHRLDESLKIQDARIIVGLARVPCSVHCHLARHLLRVQRIFR